MWSTAQPHCCLVRSGRYLRQDRRAKRNIATPERCGRLPGRASSPRARGCSAGKRHGLQPQQHSHHRRPRRDVAPDGNDGAPPRRVIPSGISVYGSLQSDLRRPRRAGAPQGTRRRGARSHCHDRRERHGGH